MSHLLQPLIILLCFVLVRAGDLAFTAGMAKDTLRAVLYGLVAILALIVLFITLLGLHF